MALGAFAPMRPLALVESVEQVFVTATRLHPKTVSKVPHALADNDQLVNALAVAPLRRIPSQGMPAPVESERKAHVTVMEQRVQHRQMKSISLERLEDFSLVE